MGALRLVRDFRNVYAYFRGAEYPVGRLAAAWLALCMAVRGPW